ncbi:hypothetical protein LTR37_016276 [Vermiconidia calcicola]|uniref:Uncharacterized protein n=1 Tax=Vermiconidia calcicola TaxID=1690605 RepID=A0ACC3MPT8_9PEZI|nr:hypothetical protein LTR37_016276 [Vermiconidia calcicola]
MPGLPSVSPTPPSNAFEADIQQVRSTLIDVLENGRDVVIVFHGYGGLPSCAALKGIHDIPNLQARVTRIVAYSSWLVPEGRTLQDELGGDISRLFNKQNDLVYYHAAGETCYNAVPNSIKTAALELLLPQAHGTFTAAARYEAWRDFPITYIFCDKDEVLPPRYREIQPGSLDPRVRKIPHGHAAHAVVPAWVAAIIREAAGEKLLQESEH